MADPRLDPRDDRYSPALVRAIRAEAEVLRLREWIATEGRGCPSAITVDGVLKESHAAL